MSRIFITGLPRSGTSLLLRLLGDAPGRMAFSQPLPLLLSEVRRRYLHSIGRDETQQAYPFADDQYENYSAPDSFAAFLSEDRLSVEAVRQSLDAMRSYSGQRYRPADRYAGLNGWSGGELSSFIERYFGACAGERTTRWVWKELSAEPLIRYLAACGWQPLIILRDPRDAIASMYFGRGLDYVGAPRPLLFLARQWRRSALYALARPFGVVAVRYEALVADPAHALTGIPGAQPILVDALTSHENSSFNSNSTRIALSERDRRFVEAICFAEMVAMGYEPGISAAEIKAILDHGPAQEALQRPVLERFLWSERRREEERDRRRRIVSAEAAFCSEAFLFVDAYQRLR